MHQHKKSLVSGTIGAFRLRSDERTGRCAYREHSVELTPCLFRLRSAAPQVLMTKIPQPSAKSQRWSCGRHAGFANQTTVQHQTPKSAALPPLPLRRPRAQSAVPCASRPPAVSRSAPPCALPGRPYDRGRAARVSDKEALIPNLNCSGNRQSSHVRVCGNDGWRG